MTGTILDDILKKLKDLLSKQNDRIERISQYSGGWEGWLQCELALCWEPGDVEREAHVWGDQRACDLYFPTQKLCVELKTFGLARAHKASTSEKDARVFGDIPSAYSGFASGIHDDMMKLQSPGTKGESGASIVIIPGWVPNIAAERTKDAPLVLLKKEIAARTEQFSSARHDWEEHAGFHIGVLGPLPKEASTAEKETARPGAKRPRR